MVSHEALHHKVHQYVVLSSLGLCVYLYGPMLLQGYGVDPLPAPSARPTGLQSGSRQASRAPSMQVTFSHLQHAVSPPPVWSAAQALLEKDLYTSLTVCFCTQRYSNNE